MNDEPRKSDVRPHHIACAVAGAALAVAMGAGVLTLREGNLASVSVKQCLVSPSSPHGHGGKSVVDTIHNNKGADVRVGNSWLGSGDPKVSKNTTVTRVDPQLRTARNQSRVIQAGKTAQFELTLAPSPPTVAPVPQQAHLTVVANFSGAIPSTITRSTASGPTCPGG